MSKTYEVEVGMDENLTEAANRYYKLSKKMRKKIDGVNIALKMTAEKIKNADKIKVEKTEIINKRDKFWFEKYRFSFTRNNMLILAGKDATSNEIVVKKHMEKTDLHFHTNIQGSAHVILKDGQNASKEDYEDTALISAIYSKALPAGLGSVDVYFVKPEQVTKAAQTGEFLSTGSFVIRGERNWFKKVRLEFSIGMYKYENQDICIVANKPIFEITKSPYFRTLVPGRKTKSEVCNQLLSDIKKLGYKQVTINDLLSILPAGKFDFKKN